MFGGSYAIKSYGIWNHWFTQVAYYDKSNRIILSSKGRHASQDEITACAYQAVTLDQQYGGEPVQVRVSMGKEPRHFMAIFKGKLVIFEVL